MEYSKEMNIWERVSAISSELKAIDKSTEVGSGSARYKAAVEADVLRPVKALEAKYRVVSFPVDREIVYQSELVKERRYEDKNRNTVTTDITRTPIVRLKVKIRFVNLDNTSDFIETVAYGDGVDSLDKAPGKAMTYSDKYALMKAYKMLTGDDPDQNASDELEGHDIHKIKERFDRLMTQKIKGGRSEDEIISAMGITRKQFEVYMKSFQNVAAIEDRLRRV